MAVRYLENPFLRLSLKAISSLLVSIIFSTGCTLSTSIEDLASKVESTTPTVSISDTSFTEGSIGSFTVSLSQPTTLPVTVAYTMVDETATSPADYIGATGILTIPAGQSSGTVSINIVDDSVYEGNETFRFEISAVNNADMGPVTLSKQITITDNDSVPDISIADASVTEGGTLSFTVSLSHASKYPVTFDYVTQDGTGANKAVSPGDYTALSTTTATIPAGSLTTTLSVTTLQDSTYEQDELMNVVLSNPGTANIVDNTGVGTIVNDDTSPTFSISNVSATESQNVDFVIDISSPSEVPITFTWQTNDGTAVGGSDFTTQAPTLVTIPALTTQITLSVPTMNDSIAELSEQFSITVSGLTGATAGVVTATGTITDNDSDPFMWTGNAFPDTNWTTGANWYGGSAPNSSQTAIFNPVCAHCDAIVNSNISVGGIRFDVGYTGTVTQSSSQTITVGSSGWTQSSGNFAGSDANISVTGDVSVSGGSLTSTSTTFTAGNNLTLASGTLIPNGGTIELYSTPALHSCSVTLNTGTNALNHFKINRNNGGSCGSIVTTTGTVTINGNMDIYNIGLPGSTSALNGGQFDVSGNVDMTMNYSGGSSIIQFNGTGNQTISQSAGVYPSIKINKTSGTLTLPSAVLKLSSDWTHLAGTVDTSGNTIQFAQISSGVGSTSTITTTGMSFNHLELVKNRAGSNTSISGTITVLGNMTVNNVTAGASDRISGGTINVLGNLTMLASTGGSATLQIVGTGAQTLSGTGGNLPNLLVNKPSGTLTISGIVGLAGNLTHTAGTVVSTGSTFIRTSAPNLSQCSSTITPNTMEFDNFYFNSTCGGGGPTTDTISGTLVVNGTLTINNSGPSGLDVINGGSISAKGNISMTAGDSGTTNIILSGTGTQNITHSGGTFPGSVLTLNKPSGSAHLSSHLNLSVSGQDLTLNSGSLYMGGYNLTINDRLTLDSGTSLFTECGTLSYGALTNNGTIVNGSDVLLSVNDVTVNEGNNAVFSIALSGASCSDVTFNYATSNGTAIAGTHYTSTSGSQTLTAGSTTLNITVPTLDDSCYSGSSKAMSLTLSSITGTGVLDNVGVGTIDDLATKPTVQFTSTGSTVAESVGTVTITAQRTGASCSATSVPYNISGTATSGSDYTITASPLTIAAGASGLSATSTVTVSDDSTLEATETVILDLQTMTNADIGTNSTYTLNITDNDLGAFSISGIQGSNGIDTTNDAYLSQDTHAVVSWSSSVGATSYNVLIYQDDGATIQCAQQNTTSTSYDFSSCNLTGGTYYRASVTATDGTSSGPASNNTYRFYVNQNPVATSTGPWYVMSTSSININALYAAPPSVGIASDSDSGQTLTFTSANNGTYGTVTNNSTYITYTPSSSTSTGADSFSVTINDGVGGSLTTTINIYVVTAFTWTGNTNNTWSSGTASNWCGSINSNKNGCTGTGSVPGASDVAVIDSTCSSGNCTPTTNYNVSVAGIRANGLTLNQGVGFTFTLGTTGWIQNGGVFNGSNSNITTAAFTINAGSFTSTSGTLAVYRASTGNETYFKVDSSASFLPNNGTVKISSGCWNCNYTSTLDVADGFNFYNLSLTKVAGGGAGATYQPITGRKIIILNNFSHGSDEYVDPVISLSGTWEVQGNFYVKGEAKGGTGTITLNGTGNQSYDTTNSGISVNLVINKASGNVTPSGTELNIGSFDLQSGTFTAPTGTFYIKHYAASASVTLFKIAATATYNHNNGTLLLKTANTGCSCATTTTVDVPDAFQFYNVTVSQHNANFGTTTAPVTGRKIVVLNNLSHGSDDFVGAANTLLSGNWEVQGNLYVKAEANGGSGTITLNGTGNQSYSTTNSGVTANVVVNKTSGTVTPLSSEFNINSFDLQSGTFTAPTSTFYIKHFAPSASVTMFKIAATATYNHNNGTLLLKTANSGCFCPTTTTVDVPDAFQFYNVTVSQHNANFGTTTAPVTGRKIVVLNNFSHGSDDFVGAANTLLSGNWEVQGNLYVKAEANRGTGNITFTGSGSQTYTRTNGTPTTGTWTVNKSGGSLQLLSNLTLNDATQDLTISAGTLDMNGYNLTLGRNITNNDTLKRGNSPSCGTITQGGSYTGNAAICP